MSTDYFEGHNLDESIHKSRPKHFRLYMILLDITIIIILAAIFGSPHMSKLYSSWQASHTPTQQQIVAQLMRRTLHIPSLSSTQPCPVSPYHTLVNDTFGMDDYGVSPAFLDTNYQGPNETLPFPLYSEGPSSWQSIHTGWKINIGYHGILLFRGERIDQPGGMRFNYRIEPPDLSWFFSTNDLASVNATKDRYYISFGISPRVQSPGCYAIQVDGQTFSEVIVIQIVQRT